MDSGLQTVFLIDEAGHSLADPVFRRCAAFRRSGVPGASSCARARRAGAAGPDRLARGRVRVAGPSSWLWCACRCTTSTSGCTRGELSARLAPADARAPVRFAQAAAHIARGGCRADVAATLPHAWLCARAYHARGNAVRMRICDRWGLKFFNSDGILRLGDKQHTYDMCSPAADIVRQEFAAIAHSLSVQAPKAAGAGSIATSFETRCKNIKTALQDLLGDGLRDGSFPESTGRSAGVGSVSSVARTHHAVYLFSPCNGPVALLGGGDACPSAAAAVGGLTKELRNDAKRLNEAFRKYSIVLQVVPPVFSLRRYRPLHGVNSPSRIPDVRTPPVRRHCGSRLFVAGASGRLTHDGVVRDWQWVDTSSAVTKLASAQPGRSCADGSNSEALQACQASLSPFLLECIKDCKGSRIPFEALLQPGQVMPFSMILVTSSVLACCSSLCAHWQV